MNTFEDFKETNACSMTVDTEDTETPGATFFVQGCIVSLSLWAVQ